MRFRDQVVWITGASSGIGEALAYRFANEGARLVLSSRRPSELERVRRQCARPDDHVCVPLDVTDPAAFPHAIDRVITHHGRIDVLVNNAGTSQRALALDTAPEVERGLMEVNYFAPVALSKAVLPIMLRQGGGRLVVISSVMGYVGTPGRSTYAAAKHALHGYFDSLRAELWTHGIGITLACPGYVRTNVSLNALGPQGQRRQRTEETHERGITPDRCAAAIVAAVAKGRNEVHVGGREVLGIYLQRFAPRLFARIVRRLRFSVHAQDER